MDWEVVMISWHLSKTYCETRVTIAAEPTVANAACQVDNCLIGVVSPLVQSEITSTGKLGLYPRPNEANSLSSRESVNFANHQIHGHMLSIVLYCVALN